MRKLLLSAGLCLTLALSSTAQTVDNGTPPSWNLLNKSEITFTQMPAVNVAEQLAYDEENRINGLDKVFRFGFEHDVNIDILSEGFVTIADNGDKITRYGVYCPEALSINLIFSTFNLAEGASLYLYNDENTSYIGAHTAANNNDAHILGTGILYNSNQVIEIIEPANVIGQSELVLGTVVHGYRAANIETFQEKGFGDSQACNVDVNCPAGAGWEKQRNSVARILVGGGWCSGSLVNNTASTLNNITPYFLTANHCVASNVGSPGAMFYFRFESPAGGVSCATTSPSQNTPANKVINGATLKANDANADFLLVELNSAPLQEWDVWYNGWNKEDNTTTSKTIHIHHPAGDIKKIAINEETPEKVATWFNGNENTRFWDIDDYEVGVTEPGSSGSPLFDDQGRTIGVLSGGSAACSGTTDNGGYDWYGRFGIAWDELPENNKQLKHWLDPTNSGVSTLDGTELGTASIDENEVESFGIYPNPASNFITVNFNDINDRVITVVNSVGAVVKTITTSDLTLDVNVSDFAKGVYFVNVNSNGVVSTERLVIK